MARGSTRSTPSGDEMLFQTLGKQRVRVEHYLRETEVIRLIGGGGSDRRFFRLTRADGSSVVLMASPPADQEFVNYLETGRFLHSIGAGVPHIYEAFPDEHLLVMEDLGDTSLYHLMARERNEGQVLAWYEKVLDQLLHMQVEGRKAWDSCPRATQRTFDYAALRWETEYFRTSFVRRYCAVDESILAGIEEEFDALAGRIAGEPVFFMHRDFQSQNIMIHENAVRVIDFQGARKGLLQYDLASLLKDAYVVLSEELQQKLIACYLAKLAARGVLVHDHDRFREVYALAGLQRNMQALGAFAFLSREKGKTWFEEYIPAGVHHLKTALSKRSDFPRLRGLVEHIADSLLTDKDSTCNS